MAEAKPAEDALRSTAENGIWSRVDGVWKRVFGSFPEEGRSVEWHDFRVGETLDWGASFHEGSLEICLNFSGTGSIGREKTAQNIESGQCAVYTTAGSRFRARRAADQAHRFLTIEMGREFLNRELQFVIDGALPEIRNFCAGKKGMYLGVFPLPAGMEILRSQLLEPPVTQPAFTLWYQSKITEILSRLLFTPDSPAELFCEKLHRVNRERCERVVFLLERDMENPPSLEMLAQEVGCSPFHLSRLFAEEMGASIPATLRRLRIDRAARLLRSGEGTVTEIAMQVGYSSLGAFNKAFADQIGCPPGQLLKKTASR